MGPLYMINHGQIALTPHIDEKETSEYTITVLLGETYYKLHHQLLSSGSPQQVPFLKVGSGRITLFLDRNRLTSALGAIVDLALRRSVDEVLSRSFTENALVEAVGDPSFSEEGNTQTHVKDRSLPCQIFYGVLPQNWRELFKTGGDQGSILDGLICKGYKPTCKMASDHTLEIIATRVFSRSHDKKVQGTQSIWAHHGAEYDASFPLRVRVKGSSRLIENEEVISRWLREKSVPHIMPMQLEPAQAGSQQGFLGMKLADYGDFAEYSKNHYDPKSGRVREDFKRQHLMCMYYIAETLAQMHEKGIVYGDLKAANILLTQINPLEVFLTDFGLTRNKGKKLSALPGTCPPPECVREYHRDLVLASYEADVLRREGTERGMATEEFKIKIDELHARHGVMMTPSIDVWSFGVLLLKAMYSENELPNRTLFSVFNYDDSAEQIEQARDLVIEKVLNKQDAIDQIIALLLMDVSKRISMEEAKRRLSQFIPRWAI